MGEKVRAAGVRAVQQVQATTWAEIQVFLDAWDLTKTPELFEAIVKPVESTREAADKQHCYRRH